MVVEILDSMVLEILGSVHALSVKSEIGRYCVADNGIVRDGTTIPIDDTYEMPYEAPN